MRRVVRLLAVGGLVVWLLRRRGASHAHGAEGVTIGFADGSATVLDAGSSERDRMIAAAGDLA